MVQPEPILVTLVRLVDWIPEPPTPVQRKRGRPKVDADGLIVKALIIRIIRRWYSATSLLAFLEQETALTRPLRGWLTQAGRFPWRRTWERRLKALPETLPGRVGCLGRCLVELLHPWQTSGRAVAVDRTPLRAKGGVWHKKHRDKGEVPHSSIDTEAGWSKSGDHGWGSGWKRQLAGALASVWIPLAAELTVANTDDASVAPALLNQVPAEVRFVLGDRHYNPPDLRRFCQPCGFWLVATGRGASPHTDAGVEGRRVFHQLRSQTIEPFNGWFKHVFEWGGQVPVKGWWRTQLFVLGAVLVYQFHHHQPLGLGVKALLRAA
jgi:hypothetical protein